MGPMQVSADQGIDVGPHPHIGLQTVTWLLDGAVRHCDSLGNEQVIRPGQLNLMTSANGISHSEERTGDYSGPLEGIQLWIALPDHTRHGAPAFDHHADLPVVELAPGTATVLSGEFAGAVSPARQDTPLVGADLRLEQTITVALRPDFEYGLIVATGKAAVDGTTIGTEQMAYLGGARQDLTISVDHPARVVLIGGEPFGEQLLMWNNYVARETHEIDEADRDWLAHSERFGEVESALARHDILRPPWRAD